MTEDQRVVRCPTLVGRRRELAALTTAIEAAANGATSGVLVLGPAGVGKSRLVDEATRATRGRPLVLVGRGVRMEHHVPYAPLTGALLAGTRDHPPPEDPSLAPFVAVLARLLPHWRTPGSDAAPSEEPATVVGEAVFRLLRWMGRPTGVVLLLEDLHWADEDTITATAHLVQHLAGSKIAVVLTAREDEPGSPAGLASLAASCDQVLPLTPLGDHDAEAMAAACLDVADVPPGVLEVLRERADGLPLLIEDLLGAAPDVGSPRFADVVRARRDALSERTRRIVELAAVAGDRVDVDLLVAASMLDRASVTAALHEASRHQLLSSSHDQLGFRHALTADVIRADLLPHQRADLAYRVVTAMERAGVTDPAPRGELWAVAGDADRAAASLLDAARQAAGRGSLGIAVALYDRVLALATQVGRREATVERLGVLVDAGHLDEAQRAGDEALDVVISGRDHDVVRLHLAQVHLSRGDHDAAAIHLEAVRRGGGGDATTAARVRLLETHRILALEQTERVEAAAHLAGQAVGLAEAAGDAALTCEALELLAVCERGRSLEAALVPLERMLRLADEHHLALWRVRALNEIGAIELLRDAVPDRLLRARDAARALGAPGTSASIEVNLAALYVMTGRLDDARAASTAAVDLARPLGLVPIVAAATMIDGLALGHAGDRIAMERSLRAAEALTPGDADLLGLSWAAGRGVTSLLLEDHAEARTAFERGDAYPSGARTLNPARGPLLLVRAVAGEDVLDEVVAAAAIGAPDARYPHLWLGFARAVTLGRRGDHQAARASFDQADRLGRPFQLFRPVALRLVAEAAIRDGWGTPGEWLRDAEAVFTARALPRAASACRSLLGRLGERPTRRRGVDRELPEDLLKPGVTAREAEVLDLVAQRLTNQEIADRLYLSHRTVEKHVGSLMRKTATSNRRALADLATRR